MAFDDTQWSLVLRAGSTSEASREAMASLCQTYWPSLYSFLRARGFSKDDASDLLQGFFLKLLEKHWVSDARREAGRFRTFLLTALTRYVSNDYEKNRAQKRGGGISILRIDADDAEDMHQRIPSSVQGPEETYERQWAHGILTRAMGQLGADYRRSNKVEIFDALSPLLAAGGAESTYDSIAKTLGMTSGALRVASHRMRGRYREIIREIVAETVASADEVDDEIRYLIQVLSGENRRKP